MRDFINCSTRYRGKGNVVLGMAIADTRSKIQYYQREAWACQDAVLTETIAELEGGSLRGDTDETPPEVSSSPIPPEDGTGPLPWEGRGTICEDVLANSIARGLEMLEREGKPETRVDPKHLLALQLWMRMDYLFRVCQKCLTFQVSERGTMPELHSLALEEESFFEKTELILAREEAEQLAALKSARTPNTQSSEGAAEGSGAGAASAGAESGPKVEDAAQPRGGGEEGTLTGGGDTARTASPATGGGGTVRTASPATGGATARTASPATGEATARTASPATGGATARTASPATATGVGSRTVSPATATGVGSSTVSPAAATGVSPPHSVLEKLGLRLLPQRFRAMPRAPQSTEPREGRALIDSVPPFGQKVCFLWGSEIAIVGYG